MGSTIIEIDADYLALIHSDRVSRRTRALLLERLEPAEPAILDETAFTILRAVLRLVVPGAEALGVPARLDAQLGAGDGWRFAGLPPDAEACRLALMTLDGAARAEAGHGFADLPVDMQEASLARVAAGEVAGALDGPQMKQWFEDLRAAAARLYVSHPAVLAQLRYSGIGYGGDGGDKPGFTCIGLGEREGWEP